ncbi:MT-A70-domain-containing protein [Phycomyces nitens]|nr:MT-A70-domain-containing protein [Phycomyces nitens]
MHCVASTEHVDIVNCQAAFSMGLNGKQTTWNLRPGEFEVHEPYFRAKVVMDDKATEHKPKKRQKTEKSVTEVETEKRHNEIRDFLLTGLQEVEAVWEDHGQSQVKARQDKDLLDFTQMASLVNATRRFALQEDHEPILLKEDCTEIDTLGVFDTIVSNPSEYCRTLSLSKGHNYLIPLKSSFLMGDLDTSMDALTDHVHRSSHYETQDIYDFFKIPLPSLSSEEGPLLVAVWVTNRPKYRQFVMEKLFKAWGVTWVTDWYWLKLTTKGEPVMPLDSPHRKPYEQLIIGRRTAQTTKETETIIPPRIIASVPCSRHSRKPPLDSK